MRVIRRFWQDDNGATALEAGIVIPFFVLLVAMLVQVAVMLFVQTILDNATRDAARLIAVGYVQQNGGAAAFVNQICNNDGLSGIIPSCSTSLQYDVVAGSSFAGLSPANTLGNRFVPGGPGQMVFIQVGYNLPAMFAFVTAGWPLISSVAIQNELYQ